MINLSGRRNFSKLEGRCFSNWGEEFTNLDGGIDKFGDGIYKFESEELIKIRMRRNL